ACVYGTLDFVGYPRFPAPVEFIAAVIAYYVHPVNIQTACLIMEGAEFTENIINGVERPVKAAELFAFTLRRSEERRVGKECRCRWSEYNYKINIKRGEWRRIMVDELELHNR